MNDDLIIQKIIKLEEDVADIKERLGRVEINTDNILSGQDKMIRILERVDQERTFTNVRLERLEQEVNGIKLHLHLA